MAAIAATV
jgi:predicted acylesterase/phospholipase RssA